MRMLLIPGLWLDASSWDAVLPYLSPEIEARPLTMPGVGLPGDAVAGIDITTWVDAVVAEIDASPDPVVVVGHSGGGNVAWGAADRRPDRVARAVFVDTVPPPPGSGISEFAVADGVVPFPGWDFFPEEDTFDLDPATRRRAAERALSVPAAVTTSPLPLAGGRYGVPVTLLMGGLTADEMGSPLAQWGAYGEEFAAIDDVEVVRIGSGHWPQFSVPERLGQLLSTVVE
ncbi:alpha/beta fold hydrolase [Microbacterium indicum]|uniref:alpha/beta fold hydrolase n=1 Tax=Microbacterium indicum TaxID=358100 RepID=UPI000491B67A|nr:alpha/beta hydrolase [Microbacterium indicum]